MSLLRKTLPAAITFAALAPAAQAGQIFSFQNPIPAGSFNNALFETVDLLPGAPNPTASIENLYSGSVTLDVTNFDSLGAFTGSSSQSAKYFLSNSGSYAFNDVFEGSLTSSSYTTGDGLLTFVNPSDDTDILLQISFTASTLSFGNFAAAGTIGFSGSLKTTGEIGNENASFGFPNRYTQNGNNSIGRHTGSFTSSIGQVTPVPEPSSIAALALGGLVLLRRRRRA